MRLSISNIAWDVNEDEEVAALLQSYGVDAIDIAPSKYFTNPFYATDKEIYSVKNWWLARGIEITGMQALLFGTNGLNIFSSQEIQNAMLNHLSAVCRIAKGLGATRLVFGSPKNRDCSGYSEQQAIKIATSFFCQLGDIAQDNGVVMCLEPNPICYGANFMTSSPEAAYIVREVGHPSIKMQLDIGSLAINNENIGSIVQEYSSIIGHVHASEPDLVPLGDGKSDHYEAASVMNRYLTKHLVSIEMAATKNESHKTSIERSLCIAIKYYRNSNFLACS